MLLLLLIILSGCGKNEVQLQAKSNSWIFTAVYQPSDKGYIEKQTIEYIGSLPIDTVDISLNYRNNSFTGNTLKKETLVGVGTQELVTRTEVKTWKDTTNVKIVWMENNSLKEETISLNKINTD